MAFFEDLTKKAKNVAAVAADKAKDAAEITKLSVAIAGEQREIDKNYRAIGEWYVNEYEGEIPDGVRDLVEAVAESKAKIAELMIRFAPFAAQRLTASSAPSAAHLWVNKKLCFLRALRLECSCFLEKAVLF